LYVTMYYFLYCIFVFYNLLLLFLLLHFSLACTFDVCYWIFLAGLLRLQ